MNMNWGNFLIAAGEFRHQVFPSCPDSRIQDVQASLGLMPKVLIDMLKTFNGGKFYIDRIPLITIFGISPLSPEAASDPGTEWHIDQFAPKWRISAGGREKDWPIAMTNYGGLIILQENERVREWDTGQGKWSSESTRLEDWINRALSEGKLYMADS